MNAKVAIVIGDYSNGWSDAIIVQNYLPFKQDNLKLDRETVMGRMSSTLINFMSELEANEKINPKPLDEKCCDEFVKWAKELSPVSMAKLCPYCGTKITKERKEKFFTGEA